MPYINLKGFSGIVPRTGPTSLAPNEAQVAKNVKIQSGELRPWRDVTLEYSPTTANVKSIYKFRGPAGTNPVWLEWASDVNVITGLVAETTEYRLYYSSDSFNPRKTNWNMATGNGVGVPPYPNNYLELGTPAPASACIATAAGTGTAPVETRAYIYTYVTSFGSVLEESAPSPATTVSCNSAGDTVTLTGFATPPTGNYAFTYIRIYRTVTGSTTVNYQLVAQIPVASTSYADTKTIAQLGDSLTSLYYTPPPSGLQGFVAMPNGIIAGFVGNQIWFCEPYLPHAWPSTYMLTTEFPIVGLGVFGNSLFVGTTKNPYIVTGTTPGSMAQEKLPLLQPCVSKKSIVSDQFGVMYASPSGLVAIGPGQQDVISNALYTRDEWALLAPETMIGAVYNNMYIGFYTVSGVTKSIVILRNDNPPLIELEFDGAAIYIDSTTSSVFALSKADNKIYKIDSSTTANKLYTWKSKKFVLSNPMSFAAMKMQADYAYMAAASGRYITAQIYADGSLVHETNITSQEPLRLPVLGKAYVWEIQFLGNVPLREFHMATSIGELREI